VFGVGEEWLCTATTCSETSEKSLLGREDALYFLYYLCKELAVYSQQSLLWHLLA